MKDYLGGCLLIICCLLYTAAGTAYAYLKLPIDCLRQFKHTRIALPVLIIIGLSIATIVIGLFLRTPFLIVLGISEYTLAFILFLWGTSRVELPPYS